MCNQRESFLLCASKMTVEAYLRGTHSWTPGAWKVRSQYWRCFCCTEPCPSFFLQALAAAFHRGLAGSLRECTPSYFWVLVAQAWAASLAMALGKFPVQKLVSSMWMTCPVQRSLAFRTIASMLVVLALSRLASESSAWSGGCTCRMPLTA